MCSGSTTHDQKYTAATLYSRPSYVQLICCSVRTVAATRSLAGQYSWHVAAAGAAVNERRLAHGAYTRCTVTVADATTDPNHHNPFGIQSRCRPMAWS